MRTHTHRHFNALSVSDELNLIYTGLRYYSGSMWGQLKIQKVLYRLHRLLITADTAGHSLPSGWESNRNTLTHMQAHTQTSTGTYTTPPHSQSHNPTV